MEITEQLKKLVRQEAANLKLHATKEELEKITIKKLNPEDTHTCIYGLATGNCFSIRATELITKCATRLFTGYIETPRLNRKPKGNERVSDKNWAWDNRHWSPIEVFIVAVKDSGNTSLNQALISYLRGETETLNI